MREEVARAVLAGFGDANLGEWTQDRPQAFHIRRRLNPQEQVKVGDAVDLRGTAEAIKRFIEAKKTMPDAAIPLALEELGIAP